MMVRAVIAFTCVFVVSTAAAEDATVDFESDVLGNKGAEFVSVDSPLVTFSGAPGTTTIAVRRFFDETDGVGIEAQGTNTGITMRFGVPVNSLSVLFGNDDPSAGGSNFPEDRALLQGFLGSQPVGQSVVPFNFNDLADQTISLSGVGDFDRAVLTYVTEDLVIASNLGEVIDEITFSVVPEPSTATLLGAGGILLLRRRHRRLAIVR